MVIISTSAVLVSIHAVSPVSTLGVAASSANAGTAASRTGSSAASLQGVRDRCIIILDFRCSISECLGVDFAGADTDGALQFHDEDLAVADLAGVRRLGDRLD